MLDILHCRNCTNTQTFSPISLKIQVSLLATELRLLALSDSEPLRTFMKTTNAILRIFQSCSACGATFHARNEEPMCEQCRTLIPQMTTHRRLTLRERQVVGLVRFGKMNKEIAHELQLTEGTIKEYLNRIFRKLNVKNRTELAIWAYQNRSQVAVRLPYPLDLTRP